MKNIVLGSEKWANQILDNESSNTANYQQIIEEQQMSEWERAGGESHMRIGYNESDNPFLVEKSGNPRETIKRGQILDESGANVIPTLILVDEELLDEDGKLDKNDKIRGSEYQIFQKYTPNSFREMYENNKVRESAVVDLGENLASLYSAGFKPSNNEYHLDEMLCDGKNTYIVDFGADIGAPNYKDRENETDLDEFNEFLDDEHYEIFEEAIEEF
jgi:hypothetical protein